MKSTTTLSYYHSTILKELGFIEYTNQYYDFNNLELKLQDCAIDYDIISAPTYLQAYEFLLPLANRASNSDEIIITIPSFEVVTIHYTRDISHQVIAKGKEEAVQTLIGIIQGTIIVKYNNY